MLVPQGLSASVIGRGYHKMKQASKIHRDETSKQIVFFTLFSCFQDINLKRSNDKQWRNFCRNYLNLVQIILQKDRARKAI